MSLASAAFVADCAALPEGTFHGVVGDRRYIVSKTIFNAGRSVKLVAEELGGTDYISLNLYHLATGARVYPCEMPLQKVVDFVHGVQPVQVSA